MKQIEWQSELEKITFREELFRAVRRLATDTGCDLAVALESQPASNVMTLYKVMLANAVKSLQMPRPEAWARVALMQDAYREAMPGLHRASKR